MQLLNREQAVKVIRRALGKDGQHQFAKENGLSQTVVSTSLTGKRGLSPKLLRAVGLEKVTAYRRKAANPITKLKGERE